MSYGSNFDLLWDGVSGDHERDLRTAALTHGKVAISGYWPFLSSAYSEQDFENRLSLSLSRISSLVAPEVLDSVVESLRDDYRAVTGASKVAEKGGKPWDKDKDDDAKDESDAAKDQAEDETGTDNDSDKSDSDGDEDDTQSGKGKSESDDDGDDKSKGNQPNWLNKSDRDKSHTDKSDKAKKESGLSVPDGGAEVAASSYAGPWHHPGGSKSYAQGYLHGKNDVLPVYTGDEDYLMGHRDGRSAKTSTYVPDPSNAGRYQYQDLESLPLNNGDLQGPDGFVQDLAEGEQRTPEAYARQTTPGTWSQGEGMPERPMPQGVQRGYQPVASYKDIDKNGCPDCGAKWKDGKLQHAKDCPTLKEFDPHHESSLRLAARVDSPQVKAPLFQPGDAVESFRGEGATIHSVHPSSDPGKSHRVTVRWDDPEKNKTWDGQDDPNGAGDKSAYYEQVFRHRHGSLRFDKEGFLVQSLVDPQIGAPLHANPYYFADGSQGLVGDDTFPTDPWGGNVPDRANQYGDVQPGVSSGSEEGYSDGKGYSRSQPGQTVASWQSPNFNVTSNSNDAYGLGWSHIIHMEQNRNPFEEGSSDHAAYEHGYAGHNRDGSEKPNQSKYNGPEDYNAGYWKKGSAEKPKYIQTPDGPEPHPDYERAIDEGNCTCGWGKHPDSHGANDIDIDCPQHGHLVREGSRATAADHYNHGFYDARLGRPYAGEEHQDTQEARTYREGWDAHHGGSAYADKATQQSLFGHVGSTDGKIVGKCNGCGDALRRHTTAHGDEIRHLQNNHVRCHGKDVGFLAASSRWGMDTEGRGESYSFQDGLRYSQDNYGTHFDKEGFLVQSGDYVSRPTSIDPTGRGDDWEARTWDAGATTRPLQSHEDRGVNTPVTPQRPLQTRNIGPENPQFDRSRTDRLEGSDEEDED